MGPSASNVGTLGGGKQLSKDSTGMILRNLRQRTEDRNENLWRVQGPMSR